MQENKYGFYLLNKLIELLKIDTSKVYDLSLYLNNHRKEITKEIMMSLKESIIVFPMYKTEEFLAYLKQIYLMNPDSDKSIKKYLENTSSKDIYYFFKENEFFANDLFTNFINMIITNNKSILYEEKKEEIISIETLPDIIRNKCENIVNKLLTRGMRMQDIARLFSHSFCMGPSIVRGNVPEINDDMAFLSSSYLIFMRIVLADVYAAIKASGEDDENMVLNKTAEYIENVSNDNMYFLPPIPDAAINFFDIFLKGIVNKEERVSNYQMLFDDEKKLYQKINPLYKIEDVLGGRK